MHIHDNKNQRIPSRANAHAIHPTSGPVQGRFPNKPAQITPTIQKSALAVHSGPSAVIQRVLIGGKNVSATDMETSDDYLEFLEALGEAEVDVQLFLVAVDGNVITEITGEDVKSQVQSVQKQMAGKEEMLSKMRQEQMLKQREEITVKRQQASAMASSSSLVDNAVKTEPLEEAVSGSDKLLVAQLGPITKVVKRPHKFIVFCGKGVAALARPGHEEELKNEVDALLFLGEKGCSTVRILKGVSVFSFGPGGEGKCVGYVMENASGLHSKEDNKSFQRKLFDMDTAAKVRAWRCLRTIMEFSREFTIKDLQLMLMDDGTVKVIDPLGISQGGSKLNHDFIVETINRLFTESLRPRDEAPDKGKKAD